MVNFKFGTSKNLFLVRDQITRFRILHSIVLLYKTINMSMCVCVFTDVVILQRMQRMQQDIMTLRNVMMSMVEIIEYLYEMLYTIIRMSEG